MRKKQWKIWAILGVGCIFMCVAYYYGIFMEEPTKEKHTFSVILYQQTDNEWASLMNGIQQAEQDFNLNINYVFTDYEEGVQPQIEAIKKELSGKTEGILLAAVDSVLVEEQLQEISNLPLLLAIETGLGDDYIKISADDYQMGKMLGKKIIEDIREDTENPHKEVVIIKEHLERDSVSLRYRGLKDALSKSGEKITIKEIQRENERQSLTVLLGEQFVKKGVYIAALDKYAAEAAVAAYDIKKAHIQRDVQGVYIYGIGNAAQLVGALDGGRMKAMVYQNEFNIGYEGIQALVNKENIGYVIDDFDIFYRLVTRETLYEAENERILFPSI